MDIACENVILEVYGQREEILKAFIAKYGYAPDEIEQVEQHTSTGMIWYVRKRNMDAVCIWIKQGPYYGSDIEYYETGCERTFIFTDGGTIENGFKYCPFCGGTIESWKPAKFTYKEGDDNG